MQIKKTDEFVKGREKMEQCIKLMQELRVPVQIEGIGTVYGEVIKVYMTINKIKSDLIPFFEKVTQQIKTIEDNIDKQDAEISEAVKDYMPHKEVV